MSRKSRDAAPNFEKRGSLAGGISKRRLTDVSLASLALAQNIREFPLNEERDEATTIVSSTEELVQDDKKSPWFSLWLSNIIQCNCGIQFSIYMMSLWPYLHKLDTSADVTFLGWIIASYSVGQAVASPVFGIWNQRTMSTKWPVAVGLLCCIIGNLVYALLPSFPEGGVKWIMLACRFLVGVGSGNYAVLRSYTASASVLKDRTRAVALATGCYALGISFGPALQMVFTPVAEGFKLGPIHFNMFTLAAYSMVIINLVAMILLFTAFTEEYAGILSKEEREARRKGNVGEYFVLPKADYIACGVCCYMFFIQNCVSTVMETLSSPITMSLYNFNDQQTVLFSGIAQAGASGIELIHYGLMAFTRVGNWDRRILLFIGLFFFSAYHVIILPYPFYNGKLDYINTTNNPNEDTTFEGGCYGRYKWCEWLPRVPAPAYWTGYALGIGFGFPYTASPTGTLFSEVIGPRNQGNLQGIMALIGSLARVVAPILSTALFESSGYVWPMAIELVVLGLGFLSIIVFWRRLVPLRVSPDTGKSLRYKDGVFYKL